MSAQPVDARRVRVAHPLTGGAFSFFADCMLAGFFAAVAALGVVTAYPGFVAACVVLRRRAAADRGVGPRAYLAALRAVARSGPAGFLVPPLIVAVLAVDLLALYAGVPGGAALTVVLAVAAGAAAVLGLRIAATWRAGAAWGALGRAALTRAARDPGGNVLLVVAALTAGFIVVAVPVVSLVLPGPLALAAVAVDVRRRSVVESSRG